METVDIRVSRGKVINPLFPVSFPLILKRWSRSVVARAAIEHEKREKLKLDQALDACSLAP